MAGKRREDENVRVINGFAGVVHKVVMFLTYPFRKPLRCILFLAFIVALAYLIPVLVYKVESKDVLGWYADKFKQVKSQLVSLQSTEPKGTDALVESSNSQTVRRQMFAKAQTNSPYKVDVLSQEADNVVDIKDIRRAEEAVEAPHIVVGEVKKVTVSEVSAAEKKVDGARESVKLQSAISYDDNKNEYNNLDYLDKVVRVEGKAIVYNANELAVDGVYIFLYGIYSNPKTEKGVRGSIFLRDLVKGKDVSCDILAYTKADEIATAKCYVGSTEINDLMVERGFSKKVSAR